MDSASSDNGMRIPCKYAAKCYRQNPAHKKEFSHPGDDDFLCGSLNDNVETDDRPECQYGTSCYRQNPQHKTDFKHTPDPAQLSGSNEPKSPKPGCKQNCMFIFSVFNINLYIVGRKRRRQDSEEYESENDKEYDLNDSFIDDSADEMGNDSDVEDEDDDLSFFEQLANDD